MNAGIPKGWIEVSAEDFERFLRDFNMKREGWVNADRFYFERPTHIDKAGFIRGDYEYIAQSGRDKSPPYHINPKYITRKVRVKGK